REIRGRRVGRSGLFIPEDFRGASNCNTETNREKSLHADRRVSYRIPCPEASLKFTTQQSAREGSPGVGISGSGNLRHFSSTAGYRSNGFCRRKRPVAARYSVRLFQSASTFLNRRLLCNRFVPRALR